jgi:hypothetical protein
VFNISDRNLVQDRVLRIATTDARIVAAAVVGSLALNEGDRWSDLDLSFAVADGLDMFSVLKDWTDSLIREFQAAHLFDLLSGPSIYRVFLLPGCLQFDLSLTPAAEFGALGPKFKILFGNAEKRPPGKSQTARELFGYAVHHAVRARISIERGRFWQAEYWISSTRDYALSLACSRCGLSTYHGRGFDNLPSDVREVFYSAFVASLDRFTLERTLCSVINGLLRELEEHHEFEADVRPMLRELMTMGPNQSSETTHSPAASPAEREPRVP